MQRYLASLVKYGLAEIVACKHHSVFRPQGVADRSVVSRSVAPPNQEHCSGLTASRFRRPPVKWEKQPGAELLIDAMNQAMKRLDSYLPVKADNYGSHRAARHWLVDDKIPLEEAIILLNRKAGSFDLDKSGGEYPHSIAYFTKGVLAEWRRIQRDRQQLKLFPKLEMQLERSSIGMPPPIQEYKSEPDRPPATEGQLAQFRAEYDRAANDPNTPRIHA